MPEAISGAPFETTDNTFHVSKEDAAFAGLASLEVALESGSVRKPSETILAAD